MEVVNRSQNGKDSVFKVWKVKQGLTKFTFLL